MPKIYISPSSQVNNIYASGDTNEAEQCREIARLMVEELQQKGFSVKSNYTGDMYERVKESKEFNPDFHICIHTNAFNQKVMGTRIFTKDTEGEAYVMATHIAESLCPVTPGESDNITILPAFYEIKNCNNTVYIEVEFHDVPEGARFIVENKEEIASAICEGVCTYYNNDKWYKIQFGAFRSKAYAERYLEIIKTGFPDAFIKEE